MTVTLKNLLIRKDNGIPICDGSIEVVIDNRTFIAGWAGNCIRQTPDGYQFTIKTDVPFFPDPNVNLVTGEK